MSLKRTVKRRVRGTVTITPSPPTLVATSSIFEAGQAAVVDLATLSVTGQSGDWTFAIDGSDNANGMLTVGGTGNAKVRSTATVLEEGIRTYTITASRTTPAVLAFTTQLTILVVAPQYIPEAVLAGVLSEAASPCRRVIRNYAGNIVKLGRVRDITGITKANPAVITSVAHGLTTGDSVTIFAVGRNGISGGTPGMTAMNSATPVVATVITADTFSVPINSTGFVTFTDGEQSWECPARDQLDFACAVGSDWVDWNAVYAALGTLHPTLIQMYGQKNSRHLNSAVVTGITSLLALRQRPRINLERVEGNVRIVSFNASAGSEILGYSNQILQIPAAVALQRGSCSITMAATVPSNAGPSGTAASSMLALGANGATRLIVNNSNFSYTANPGLTLINNLTRNTQIKLRNQLQSMILTNGYGASGATSATNFARANIEGETVYNNVASITDAAMVGGELGSNNAASRGYGQWGFACIAFWSTPLNTTLDERLMHSFHSNLGTRYYAGATHHILNFGSSSMTEYRSDNNGFGSQLARALYDAGTPVILTGFGISGQSIATANTAATTVATFKRTDCTHHTVVLHGGVNDLVAHAPLYVETDLDTTGERQAVAAAIYDSLCAAGAKFRADVSVTGNRWRVVYLTQHKRLLTSSGATAQLETYYQDVMDRLEALIMANTGGASGANGTCDQYIQSNSDPVIATYPNPNPRVRDDDDVHLNEWNGHPRLIAVALPKIQLALAA